MADHFSIEVRGLDDVMNRIRKLPQEAQDNILEDVGEYSKQVLAEKQPPYKYVSRAQAYGKQAGGMGWFSPAQRRYVMAKIRSGEIKIPYKRTGALAKGWEVHHGGDIVTITSRVPSAPFVQGVMQSRHEKMVGWKRVVDIVNGELSFRSSKFRKIVMASYQKAIRKLKLG